MDWNAQVVFRATLVLWRGAIIDLYLVTLKRGTPGLNAEFSFVYNKCYAPEILPGVLHWEPVLSQNLTVWAEPRLFELRWMSTTTYWKITRIHSIFGGNSNVYFKNTSENTHVLEANSLNSGQEWNEFLSFSICRSLYHSFSIQKV